MSPAIIGAIVRTARKKSGMTQSQLAEAIGTQQPYVSRLEKGLGGDPNISTLVRIAEALGARLIVQFAGVRKRLAAARKTQPTERN